MKLSTKGRYAMVALVDLAEAPDGALVSLAEVSRRQNVSQAYLEQLFVKLRRAGLVESVRGPGGGYRLARSSDAIRMASADRASRYPPPGPRTDSTSPARRSFTNSCSR